MQKPGYVYRPLKLVYIDYVSEDEFSIINVKTLRELLSRYIESHGKKVADRGFHAQSVNDLRHSTRATGEVIAKSQACWTD